jgi:hypothetical protein
MDSQSANIILRFFDIILENINNIDHTELVNKFILSNDYNKSNTNYNGLNDVKRELFNYLCSDAGGRVSYEYLTYLWDNMDCDIGNDVDVNQYQPILTNINQYQLIPSNINQYQPILTNINQYQLIPSNINQYQPILTNVMDESNHYRDIDERDVKRRRLE